MTHYEYEHWIDGQRRASTGDEWLSPIDPATEETYGRAPLGTAADIDAAVAAAKAAFPDWAAMSAWERAPLLHRLAQRLRDATEDLVELDQLETGYLIEVIRSSYFEFSAQVVDYYAEIARTEIGRVVPSMLSPREQLDLVMKTPVGVVGCFPPSNYPMILMFWKIAPALAAGNTVVIKPHPSNPLIALSLAERVFGELPPGVVNIVSGDVEAGTRLVAHPDVSMISYTGSTTVGAEIARVAAPMQKRLSLELSGSDAAIVSSHADLELAVEGVAYAAFKNAGQICVSTERVFVHSSVYEEFLARLTDRAIGLRVGSGLDPDTEVPPMRSAALRSKTHGLVMDAVEKGARLLAGGDHSAWSTGYFYPPTVLADVTSDMRIASEETYGPVVSVTSVESFDEAIARANDHALGLGASLYSTDAHEAHRFMWEIEAGNLWINDPLMDNIAAPFGGMKGSGNSRELGIEGLDAFRTSKHVLWDTAGRIKPEWFARKRG